MSMKFEFADGGGVDVLMPDAGAPHAIIRVVGIGGGGNNAVNHMIEADLKGVDFIAANTDVQALYNCQAQTRCQLGAKLTKGLGAGANPELGRTATIEDRDLLRETLKGSDMVFITAGMGGGTGTGGAPVVAEIAKELGALTVAVVTKPFTFEGPDRRRQAETGIEQLKAVVHTLIVIPNDRLFAAAGKKALMTQAFEMADDVLLHAVQGITDLIVHPGLVNRDFNDVRTAMSEMGSALIGTGIASGDGRHVEAAQKAIHNPLLEDVRIDGARAVLINITANSEVGLDEVSEAATLIQETAHKDAKIMFGWVIDDSLGENFKVTVIATGIGEGSLAAVPEPRLQAVGATAAAGVSAQADDWSPYRAHTTKVYSSRLGGATSVVSAEAHSVELPTYIRHETDDTDLDQPTYLRQPAD